MVYKTKEEWDTILTKEYLEDVYLKQYIAVNKIAHDLQCDIRRVKEKIKSFGMTRKRTILSRRRMDGKDRIERAGFTLVSQHDFIGKETHVDLICHCSQQFTTTAGHIFSGHTKSCGCSWNKPSKNRKGYKDLTGKQFGIVKYGAERRNIVFNITPEDVWNIYEQQNRLCLLTGIYMTWDSKYGPGNASVDRIDNLKGYTIDNIQIILKDINMMKRHHSQDYFIYLCYLCGQQYKEGSDFLLWEKESINKEVKNDSN